MKQFRNNLTGILQYFECEMPAIMKSTHEVVCFGEVLWDILPNKSMPGGAPMNVAYHLKKLGLNPALITKIGLDDHGQKLINVLSGNNLAAEYFQVDYDYPTGLVYAWLNHDNEASYDIVAPSAWDFIRWNDEFYPLLSNAAFFLYGSLTSRNKVSRDTLYQLLDVATKKVLDINLRPPHYNRNHIEYLLEKADILKMNLDELELVTGWFSHFNDCTDRMKLLRDKFNIETIIVTKGSAGALLLDKEMVYTNEGYKVEVADTIGSGDAFLAGLLCQLMNKETPSDSLRYASGLGALIATYHGACPNYDINEISLLINESTSQPS